ncbi:hypothetical protein ACTNEO_06675 [Gracilibacillus sp. HCP3S3_G5_1]|uniref:hypothetical protein n=1 Tax=unclassified Gracilibacillus TaxID=2625209 RepID=UPI003F8867BD
MKRPNNKYIMWSLLFCIVLPLFIPSQFVMDDGWRGNYTFGFPFEYITIYQHQPNSSWLFDNLFNGNSGMHIHIGALLVNIVIFYMLLWLVQYMIVRGTMSNEERS